MSSEIAALRCNALEHAALNGEGASTMAPSTIQQAVDVLSFNRRHALVFGLCAAGLFFESLNLQIMSFVAPMLAAEWKLSSGQMGMLISAAIFGMMAGTYLFGALADRYGRRTAFQVTVGLFSVMTALAGFAVNLGQLAVARFLAGTGIGGSIPVETAVLAEFTPSRLRGRLMALWAIALPVGGLIAPLCVAAMPDSLGWRGLLVLGGLPAFLVLLVRRVIPETPQYLEAKGRVAEAWRALSWIARNECDPPEDVPKVRHAALGGKSPERILFSPAYLRQTLTAWALNFGSFFSYYGFILWMPALLSGYRGFSNHEVISFVFGMAMAGLSGRVFVILIAHKIRPEAILLCFGMASATALGLFAFQTGMVAMKLSGFAAAFLLEGMFSVIIPFVAEIYPAPIRATGVGWAGGVGRFGTALAPLAIGAVLPISVEGAVIMLAMGSLVAVLAILLLLRS